MLLGDSEATMVRWAPAGLGVLFSGVLPSRWPFNYYAFCVLHSEAKNLGRLFLPLFYAVLFLFHYGLVPGNLLLGSQQPIPT